MKSPDPKSFCAVFHKQLGDMVLLEPALQRMALAQGCPVPVLTHPHLRPAVELMEAARYVDWREFPKADRVVAFDPGSRSMWRSLACRSRQKELLLLHPRFERPYHRLFYHTRRSVPLNDDYRARYYWRNAPGKGEFRIPTLRMPDPVFPAETPRHGYLLIHTTSAWRRKCWDIQKWVELITDHASRGRSILLTGGTAAWECDYVQEICDRTGLPGLFNLAGRTSLSEYLTLIAYSRAVVTIDSSAAHLALAFRRPCVTLFGPSDHRHWSTPSEWSKTLFPEPDSPTPGNTATIPLSAVSKAVDRFWHAGDTSRSG
jgi:hypothetical protein